MKLNQYAQRARAVIGRLDAIERRVEQLEAADEAMHAELRETLDDLGRRVAALSARVDDLGG